MVVCLPNQSVERHSCGLRDATLQAKLPCILARSAWLTTTTVSGAGLGQPCHRHPKSSRPLDVWLTLISAGFRPIKQDIFGGSGPQVPLYKTEIFGFSHASYCLFRSVRLLEYFFALCMCNVKHSKAAAPANILQHKPNILLVTTEYTFLL